MSEINTVQDLINKLKKCAPNNKIRTRGYNLNVVKEPGTDIVYVEISK